MKPHVRKVGWTQALQKEINENTLYMAKLSYHIHTIQVDQYIICHASVLVYHLIKFILVPRLRMKCECPWTPNQTKMGDLRVTHPLLPPGLIKNIVMRS